MRLSTTLVEIGTATPSVLNGVIGNEFASATEAIQRAACTGAKEVLENPPPVLFHPSKLHTSYFLYASQTRAEFDDVPFKQGVWQLPHESKIVGAVMMEVCKNVVCPALIYVEHESPEHRGIKELTVLVPNAPLAALEADFFYTAGPPSAFEQRWIGEGAQSGKELRNRIGKYVQSRGGVLTPSWLLTGEGYYVTREGPLALLRLRKAKSDVEEAALKKMLHGLRWENTRAGQLKNIMDRQGGRPGVSVKTVFCTSNLTEATSEWKEINDAQLEEREEMVDATDVLSNPVLGSLALLILKQVESKDYYDVDKAPDSLHGHVNAGPSDQEEAACEEEDIEMDTELQAVLSTVQSRESQFGVQTLPPALRHSKNNALMVALENTTRLCDLKKIVTGSDGSDALHAISENFFSISDAEILKNGLRATAATEGVHAILKSTGRMMGTRQAILGIYKDAEDSVANMSLYLCSGEESRIKLDDITRLVLLPWVTPLVIGPKGGDGKIYELKILGVPREKLLLSEASRFQAAQTQKKPQLSPELTTALKAIEVLPAIKARLDAMEELMKNAPIPVAVAPPVESSSGSQPARTPDSPTTRALKRTIANIETYEAAEAARTARTDRASV